MKKTPNRLKLLSASAAISAIGMLALGSTSASASGTYYTCDTPTSCKSIEEYSPPAITRPNIPSSWLMDFWVGTAC